MDTVPPYLSHICEGVFTFDDTALNASCLKERVECMEGGRPTPYDTFLNP